MDVIALIIFGLFIGYVIGCIGGACWMVIWLCRRSRRLVMLEEVEEEEEPEEEIIPLSRWELIQDDYTPAYLRRERITQ